MIGRCLRHNHGYPTVDPLKRHSIHCTEINHNHGYPTVDPLKLVVMIFVLAWLIYITTVIRPWTH